MEKMVKEYDSKVLFSLDYSRGTRYEEYLVVQPYYFGHTPLHSLIAMCLVRATFQIFKNPFLSHLFFFHKVPLNHFEPWITQSWTMWLHFRQLSTRVTVLAQIVNLRRGQLKCWCSVFVCTHVLYLCLERIIKLGVLTWLNECSVFFFFFQVKRALVYY